jgi:hypothetical protein
MLGPISQRAHRSFHGGSRQTMMNDDRAHSVDASVPVLPPGSRLETLRSVSRKRAGTT